MPPVIPSLELQAGVDFSKIQVEVFTPRQRPHMRIFCSIQVLQTDDDVVNRVRQSCIVCRFIKILYCRQLVTQFFCFRFKVALHPILIFRLHACVPVHPADNLRIPWGRFCCIFHAFRIFCYQSILTIILTCMATFYEKKASCFHTLCCKSVSSMTYLGWQLNKVWEC